MSKTAGSRSAISFQLRSTYTINGKNRGGEGTTPVTTACPEAESESVKKTKKKRSVPPKTQSDLVSH